MPCHSISLSRLRNAGAAICIAFGATPGVMRAIAVDHSLTVNQVGAPTAQASQRRLVFENLVYTGGIRLPSAHNNGDSFAGGGQAVAFNPAGPTLFISSVAGRVAEVTIPTPSVNADAKKLPAAAYLQGFADPTEGRVKEVASGGVLISSLLVEAGRLYGTASVYYDANNAQRVSHFSRSLRLSEPSFQGWTQVWESGKSGFVAGSLAAIPLDWRKQLGGAMVSGQCCVPIISRTSWGPAAFSFDPSAIGRPIATASPLLYYTAEHPTLGSWGASNEGFGDSTELGGLVIVNGTRTALYFGRNGIGEACYGAGTAAKSLVGTLSSDGAKYCYDPTSSYKGTHAYPYRYQIWAYDLTDFAAVKKGGKRPWQVVPYAIWPLEFPTPEPRTVIGGVGYDPLHQTIYVAQRHADRDDYESRPVIHTFRIQ